MNTERVGKSNSDTNMTKKTKLDFLTRRSFISKSAVGLVGASMLVPEFLSAADKTKTIGFQSWIIREEIGKDFPGSLKMMTDLGYNSIEMCSPPGYSKSGFGSLQNLKPTDLKRIINDAGMTCVSCHFQFEELKNNLQARVDFAKELGLTQMVVASFGLQGKPTMADWKNAAIELNKIGEQSAKLGMQMCFHNHNTEFEKIDGQLIYDVLLDQLDPALIKMQFQVWVVIAGYKAADYFRKYPGRFISAHLYDWSGVGQEQVPLGKGKVDWKEFFEAAKASGVKNYFVEMNMPMLKESAAYLRTIL